MTPKSRAEGHPSEHSSGCFLNHRKGELTKWWYTSKDMQRKHSSWMRTAQWSNAKVFISAQKITLFFDTHVNFEQWVRKPTDH